MRLRLIAMSLVSGTMFTLALGSAIAQAPDAPTIGNAIAGDAQVFVFFAAPSAAGSNPISGYTTTCTAVATATISTGSGATAPIAVSGLVNGTEYECAVTATNATGISTPSGTVSVTPMMNAPLTLIGVQSRKSHGLSGVFDIPVARQVAVDGAVTIEPRASNSGHSLVFQFNATITSLGAVIAIDEASAFVTVSPTIAGHEVIVSIAPITDNKRINVTVATVNGVPINTTAALGYLVGDVNETLSTSASDISKVKSRSGQLATATNFRLDVNTSGAINASDISTLKARSGRVLTGIRAPVVAKVEIEQTGLILPQTGAMKLLSAKAFDVQGNVLNVPLTWTSGKPAIVTVDGGGAVTAAANIGASQVVAHAGGVSSAPLLVVVTPPPPGAILLTDVQIIGGPEETTPGAVPSFSNTYQVRLNGIAPPPIGTILINTESKAVGGRVIQVDSTGNPIVVTLGLVSIREMFPALDINETINLDNAPVNIHPAVVAGYNITRIGNTFVFDPKVQAAQSSAALEKMEQGFADAIIADAQAAPSLPTGNLPPFKCKTTITGGNGEGAPLPFTLSAPPIFSVAINQSLDFVYTPANGMERFVINSDLGIKIEGGLNVTATFEGNIECKAELFTVHVPVGGPLSLILGGQIPVGVGIEAAGKVTVATMGIGTKAEMNASGKAGIACPPGLGCVFERSVDSFDAKLTPTLDLPSIGDLRLEPSLMAFGYLEPSLGNAFMKSLQFSFLKIVAGAKFEGSFATKSSQLADEMYSSDYKGSQEITATAGDNLSGVLSLLGVSTVDVVNLSISNVIARSPIGLANDAVAADKSSFVSGDTVNFTVKLEPATLDFFPAIGPYNIKKIQLVRNAGILPVVVGSVDALPGASTFNFVVHPTDSGTAGQFSAFAVTQLLPLDLLSVEIGAARGPLAVVEKRIAAMEHSSCGITSTGGLKCWGSNSSGQLGDGNGSPLGTGTSQLPVSVLGLSNSVVAVSGFYQHACAVTSEGAVKCWGSNTFGELGNGIFTDSMVPVDVSGLSGALSVGVGNLHTCAITALGKAKCWGDNRFGQLGNGTGANSALPLDVSELPDGILALSSGNLHTCAITNAGAVKCWGWNLHGQLGNGSNTNSALPVDVSGLASEVVAVSGASEHTCAVTSVGGVKCWGNNDAGQLGNGTTAPSTVPMDVTGMSSGVVTVSCGRGHTCAVTTAGALKCWGSNSSGQLGIGTITRSAVPVDVTGLSTGVVAVSGGLEHTCAVTTAGTVKCWGYDGFGQLGNGPLNNSLVPGDVLNFP